MSTSIHKSKKLQQSFEKPMDNMDLFSGYDMDNLLFKKCDNK